MSKNVRESVPPPESILFLLDGMVFPVLVVYWFRKQIRTR